jgi:hypothetical protein
MADAPSSLTDDSGKGSSRPDGRRCMIEPGAIYSADFEDAGPYPVIVVSRPAFNRGRYAVVVVCTSARFQQRRLLPNCDCEPV